MANLLSDVPLRTTADWSYFDEIVPLFHAYGRTTVKPIQYNETGQAWFLSEGAIFGVVSAKDSKRTFSPDSYRFSVTSDIKERTISIIEFAPGNTPDEGLEITVLGKVDLVDGTMMNNPAVVAWDFLNNVAGIVTDRSKFDRLRIECLNAGIEYAGVIGNNSITNRAQFDQLMFNAGAIGSVANAFEIAALYPVLNIPDDRYQYDYDDSLVLAGTSQITTNQIITTLNIEYAYSPAKSKYTKSIKLRANNTGFDDTEKSIQLPLVQDQRTAYSIGARYLSYWSRALETFSFNVVEEYAPPVNAWVDINHRYCSTAGAMFVLSSELNFVDGEASIDVERSLGTAPTITILNTGEIFAGTDQEVQVTIQDNAVTIYAKDQNGKVLPSARITLDTKTVIADAEGKAVFIAVPGVHSLSIEYQGKTTFRDDNYLIQE